MASYFSVFVTVMALIIVVASAESRPCDDIYVVKEGETLHTISAKCGDPFIVDNNPHIQDSDDVFPGLLIQITPTLINSRKLLL
ncbi:hypothetical protein Csa_005039 [Cucumis sativus]|uniref:LysM domain-containing protein n=1 Tax=Cucumis sativus TaxID=3659 RepID=A0A0A0K9P3_CUCSA|nr:hypothetical protein Csa_005039 [Cucumis sativus]